MRMAIAKLTRLFSDLTPLVERTLSSKRFEHVTRVITTAEHIAKANELSPLQIAQVRLAALLHDLAREYTDEELLAVVPARNAVEAHHPMALHGAVAAELVRDHGVTDEVVLEAIELHAFGCPATNLVAACLYVADKTEPGRGILADARELALSGKLAEALCLAIRSSVKYLEEHGKEIHPTTYDAYQAAC